MTFYKVNIENMGKLQQPLDVTLAGENGIDGGALKVELFAKTFEIARSELFEHPDQMPLSEIP